MDAHALLRKPVFVGALIGALNVACATSVDDPASAKADSGSEAGAGALGTDGGLADSDAMPPEDASVTCAETPTGNACVTCCGNAHPAGAHDLRGTNLCECDECTSNWCRSACNGGSAPQSPCIACVKKSLATVCGPYTGDVRAYVDCIQECSD